MNKLAFAAVFAVLIGAAVAQPTQDAEAAMTVDEIMNSVDDGMSMAGGESTVDLSNMKKEDLYFADFCSQATDVFRQFLQSKVDGTSAKVYNILFTSIQEVGQAVIESQRVAVNEGGDMIETVAPEVESEETEVVAPTTMVGKVREATMRVIRSMFETAKTQLFVRLAELKELYNIDTLKETIEDVCSSISNDLLRRLDQTLSEAKNSIKKATSKAPDAKEILAIVQKAKVHNVGCKLTSRVQKVSEACVIYKLGADKIWSILGAE